jgi:hypothetical protein
VLPVVHVPLTLAELDHFTTVTRDAAGAQAAWRYLVDHARWWSTAAGRRLLGVVTEAAGG